MFPSLDFYFTFDNVPLIKNKYENSDLWIFIKNLRREALQLPTAFNL